MVVGVSLVAGERGDHLVGVHVRGRSRAGLEGIDRELVVVLALGDLVAGTGDALGEVGVQQAQLGVHARGRGLDAPEPVDDLVVHRVARDREVLDRLGRLRPP